VSSRLNSVINVEKVLEMEMSEMNLSEFIKEMKSRRSDRANRGIGTNTLAMPLTHNTPDPLELLAQAIQAENRNLLKAIPCSCRDETVNNVYVKGYHQCERCKQLEETNE